MTAYIRLITSLSLPITYVAQPEIHNFCKFDAHFRVLYFKEVIFKLTELVEKRITTLMSRTRGAILHDGWTHNGTHYFGVYASFMKEVRVVRNGFMVTEEEICTPLISVSPISKASDLEDEENYEATEFDAVTHVRQLEDIFHIYGINFHEWMLCFIADNAPVNKRIAKLIEVPHVGCLSHKLNLEVNLMVENDKSLSNSISSIATTMKNCKTRIKCRAMLRNLTHLSPLLYNKTRWSGKYAILVRFLEIREELIKVADTDGAAVTVNRSENFKKRTEKYANMLREINCATTELQKRNLSFSDCRYIIDTLLEEVEITLMIRLLYYITATLDASMLVLLLRLLSIRNLNPE